MKKTLYTLSVDNYPSEITNLTHPLLKRYAEKIDAQFFIIKDRKWPNLPPVYEKLQIYELSKKHKNDWNIYIDSDALVHPDFFDVTEFLHKETVCHNGADMANNRWKYDKYFRRDRRNIGSCNWFTVASDWCVDLWMPLDDLTFEEAIKNIYPIQSELNSVITREHLIDDYILSRNIAKFGLKFTTVGEIQKNLNDSGNYLWHQYTITTEEKVLALQEVIDTWKV
jgi:hypothetical protein